MSANADRLIDLIEAFNARDVPRMFAGLDPEVEWQPQQAALQGDFQGHDGVMKWLADLAQVYEDGHLEIIDTRDLGERVLALGTLHFVGKGSGIETGVPVAIVADFREGLMTRLKDYGDRREALAAVGLTD
jgi:ketosteroid isomerase-like protein